MGFIPIFPSTLKRTYPWVLCSFLLLFSFLGEKAFSAQQESSGKRSSRFRYDRTKEAQDVSTFWSQHKMGLGITAAGVYGLIGGTVSILFHPQWSLDLGFGGGSHFQSFGFRVKKMLFLSSPLNPYLGLGFHRWQRPSSQSFNPSQVSPTLWAREFMSDRDLLSSRIDESLIHGSLGVQYVWTSGDWKGYGVFMEALALMSVEDLHTAPTGSLGFIYFF